MGNSRVMKSKQIVRCPETSGDQQCLLDLNHKTPKCVVVTDDGNPVRFTPGLIDYDKEMIG